MLYQFNAKRLLAAVVAVSVVWWLTDLLIHSVLLMDYYSATASLWRTEEDMKAHMPYYYAGLVLFSVFFCLIFAKGYENRGLMEGVRYGFLIGPFGIAHRFMEFAAIPYPVALLGVWVAMGLLQSMLCGLVVAAVYQP